MPLKKIISNKFFLLVVFVALYLATRLPGLGTDVINPDAVNWHYRSQQFVVGLKARQFERTYQHYHPGVTLMWVSGFPIELIKQLYPEQAVYDQLNFIAYHSSVKFFLVSVQLFLTIIVVYLLFQVLKISNIKNVFLISISTVLLFSFEPFFVGNSRLFHLDILLTLLMFIGMLFNYLAVRKFSHFYGISTGVFLGLAFLTKSVAIGAFFYAVVVGGVLVYLKFGPRVLIKYVLSIALSYFAIVFILFPALWTDPVGVIVNIFEEAKRIGVRKGHGQIYFGEYTRDPGAFFYLLVFLMKVTMVTLVGAVVFFVPKISSFYKKGYKNFKIKLSSLNHLFDSPVLYLGFLYLGYVITMIFPSKKLDRYMLPVYPFLALISVLGYFEVYKNLKKKFKTPYLLLLSVSVAMLIIFPIVKLYPYHFTYTSPLFGNAENANKIIAQKPFGVGIPALREYIFEKYGPYPRLGFIDTKPMASIYTNSKIFDARISGTSDYDLLILATNEEIPENALDSDVVFEKDSSFYINGLEYWRIYVKKNSKTN